jgi:hypothetical protein
MTLCPFCQKPCLRSVTLVPGQIVQGCRSCAVWSVQGIGEWIQSGTDLGSRLAQTVPVVEKRPAAYDQARIDFTRPEWTS